MPKTIDESIYRKNDKPGVHAPQRDTLGAPGFGRKPIGVAVAMLVVLVVTGIVALSVHVLLVLDPAHLSGPAPPVKGSGQNFLGDNTLSGSSR
jgi:hypothetical protein